MSGSVTAIGLTAVMTSGIVLTTLVRASVVWPGTLSPKVAPPSTCLL